MIHALAPQNRVKAAEYAQQAGDYALAHLAPDEAVTWYVQTLELLPADHLMQRCETLVGLGTAQRQAGDPAHRESLLEAGRLAIDLRHDDLLVRAALANNRGDVSQFGTIDEERVQILRRAIATRPRKPDGALLQAILAIELHGAPDEEVEEAASRALELAREAGDDRVIARAARLAESALRTPDALERRVPLLHEGVAAAERTGDAQLRGMLSMSYEEIALECGDRDAMNREKRIRDSFARRSRNRTSAGRTSRRGRFTSSWTATWTEPKPPPTPRSKSASRPGNPRRSSATAGQVFQIRRAQDRLAEVAEAPERILEENPALQVFRLPRLRVVRTRPRTGRSGAHRPSRRLVRRRAPVLVDGSDAVGGRLPHARPPRTRVPTRAGPQPLAGPGRQHRRDHRGFDRLGLGLALATLGRIEDAAAAYDLALTVNRRLRAPLFVARTRLAYAELLAEVDPGRAHARHRREGDH